MKKTIFIKGMHCISCEMLIEKGIKKIEGLKLIHVNHKNGKLEVEYEDEKVLEKLQKVIEENDFKMLEGENTKDGIDIMVQVLSYSIILVVLWVIYMMSRMFNLMQYIPNIEDITFGSAFLVGIIASLSTCLAITWGIIIWFSRYLDNSKTTGAHIKLQALFHVWRLVWFFLLGWILGYIGSIFQISLWATSIFNIIIALLLVYMGLHTLWFVPSITKFGIHMPKSFASKLEVSRHPQYAPIVWALTFFLPCGFTQAMQLIAINSGSFITGGLIMMIFALWTIPVLFSVWLGSSYFKDKKFDILNKAIGTILVFFWIFTLSNASNFIAVSSPKEVKNTVTNTEVIQKDWDFEVVNVGHNGYETEPRTINLEAGKNYRLTITPSSDGKGCFFALLIPNLDETVHYIKKWEPITYEFKNIQPGKYNIICSAMGMKQGAIIVE